MSARARTRICPLCLVELKESRFIAQHIFVEHAHSGTKPLADEELKTLADSPHPCYLCNCSLLPPLESVPGFHKVAWKEVCKHTEQRHLAGIRDSWAAVPGDRAAHERKFGAGSGMARSRSVVRPAANGVAARHPPSDAQMSAIIKDLITGGVMLDDVPKDSRVHFNMLVNKLAEPALMARANGDFAGYEDGVLRFVVQIRKSLVLARGGRRGWLVTAINDRLARMIEEPQDELAFRVESDSTEHKAEAKEVPDGKDEKREDLAPVPAEFTPQQAARVARLVRVRLTKKAGRVLIQTGQLPEITSAIVAEMRNKIPQRAPLAMPVPPIDAPLRTFTHSDAPFFQYIARKSSKGSAPGPSQLTYRHIQRISATVIGRKMIASICSDLHNGRFSAAIKPLFLSSMCTPVPKKDGSHRPVIAGDTFRRIVASNVVHSNRDALIEAAGDFQFGCGRPNGASTLVQILQILLDAGLACLEVDVVNAFPTRDRRSIINTINSKPKLAALQLFTSFCYSSQSTIYISQKGKIIDTLLSCDGVEQGDPEGNPLFCVDWAGDIKESQAAHPNVLFFAFADNLFMVGQPRDLPPALETVSRISAAKGSHFSVPKLLFWNSNTAPLSEAMNDWISARGVHLELGAVKILGAPLGPSTNPGPTSDLALKIIQRNDIFFERLCSPLITSQISLALLRICGEGRAVHLSRCARPSITARALIHHDNTKFEVVRNRGFILSDEWNRQLQHIMALPLRLGGLGIRSSVDVADYAWFSAQASAAAFITKAMDKFSIPTALPRLDPLTLETSAVIRHIKETCIMGPDVSTLLPPDACSVLVHFADAQNQPDGAKFQHALTLSSDESFASSISNHRDARTAGLMRARTEKLAFLWKDTVPDSPDLVLSDEQVTFNLRTEYGLQPVPDGVLVGKCGMCKTFNLAHDNTHFINCNHNAGIWTRRHNECLRIMADSLRDLHCPVAIEPRKLSNKDRSRPDIDTWLRHRRILLDFTVRNDASSSQINTDVLDAAEKEKIDHYEAMSVGLRAEFEPFVTSAFGGFAKKALKFIRTMRRFGTSRSPLFSPIDVTRLMCRRLAIAIHRANYEMYEEGVGKSLVPIPET
jgi:hypothetical protein